MIFVELRNIIKELSGTETFQSATDIIQKIIFNLEKEDFIPLITEIGAIPEDIEHDSSEEKLYTKVSDIILAKCFMELGYNATVLRERANCADVYVESRYHNYSLVSDAKAFRLSRTAKNQKDFKVESMVHWKCDSDYSVLCCPYFQYPKSKSQIYGQAIKGNVSLFAWEYFNILLKLNVMETSSINLSDIWNFSSSLSATTTVENRNLCFLNQQNQFIKEYLNLDQETFDNEFESFKNNIIIRCNNEIEYWEDKISQINRLTKEEAIYMLMKSLKLNEKISSIDSYSIQLRGRNEY